MARAGDWDAARYQRVAEPHARWGASVLDRLQLSGDEVVLDAGCGSGKVTAQLLERLPRGRLIAVDSSPAMLAEAHTTLAAFEAQVSYVQTDLLELDRAITEQKVDAVFSTATFHWIDDHPRLFRAVHGVLRQGGQLVSQFGGGTNLAELMRATDTVCQREPYRQHLEGKKLWRYYASPEETRARLQQVGFSEVEAWLEDSPQTFPTETAFTDFARTVNLRNHLNALPPEQRDAFAQNVAEQVRTTMGAYTLDYVRLNADARA
jgi:trans-aconitate 2-methyltransferase